MFMIHEHKTNMNAERQAGGPPRVPTSLKDLPAGAPSGLPLPGWVFSSRQPNTAPRSPIPRARVAATRFFGGSTRL